MQIGALSITAFPKWHDAIDPHSFIISHAGVTTGVFTDIGEPCKNVIRYFKLCHAIFLEANYDETMLANSRYPIFLRNRISGRHGHLSNSQALQLFAAHKPTFMTHVFLSHLSRENNNHEVAEALFNSKADGVRVVHAPRNNATALYQIISVETAVPALPEKRPAGVSKKKTVTAKLQLSSFSIVNLPSESFFLFYMRLCSWLRVYTYWVKNQL